MNMEKKICTKCGEVKDLIEFTKSKECKNGRSNCCKNCSRLKSADWTKNNPERRKQINSNWRKNNPERDKILKKEWAQLNKEKVTVSRKKYKKTHIGWNKKYKERNKGYYRERKKHSEQRSRNILSDRYVKCMIMRQYNLESLSLLESQEIIELKRLELKAKRYIKTTK